MSVIFEDRRYIIYLFYFRYLTTTEWKNEWGGYKGTQNTGENARFRRLPFHCCRLVQLKLNIKIPYIFITNLVWLELYTVAYYRLNFVNCKIAVLF